MGGLITSPEDLADIWAGYFLPLKGGVGGTFWPSPSLSSWSIASGVR